MRLLKTYWEVYEFMSVYKEETPCICCRWLSPKLLTCLRLAQITDGQRKGRRKGRGFLSFQMANMHLPDKKHNVCVQNMCSALYHISVKLYLFPICSHNMHIFLHSKSQSLWTLRITCQVTSSMCPLYYYWYCTMHTLTFLISIFSLINLITLLYLGVLDFFLYRCQAVNENSFMSVVNIPYMNILFVYIFPLLFPILISQLLETEDLLCHSFHFIVDIIDIIDFTSIESNRF